MRGPDAGRGGYEDIPQLDFDKPEIHEERILEADEEYEKSTRKGSVAMKVVKKGSRKGSIAYLEEDDDIGFGDDGFENDDFRKGSIYPDKRTETVVSIPMGSHETSEEMQGRINRSISYAVAPIGVGPTGHFLQVHEERQDLGRELM